MTSCWAYTVIALPAGQLGKIDAVVSPSEAQFDPVWTKPSFASSAPRRPTLHQVDRTLLQHPRPDASVRH